MSLFGGMKIYTVHVKTDVMRSSEKPIFLREGFNIYAFLFTAFWALYHRLWLPAAGIIALNIIMVQLGKEQLLSEASLAVLQLGVNILVGFSANDWLRRALTKRGYVATDITAADSLLRAEQRYFERYLKTIAA